MNKRIKFCTLIVFSLAILMTSCVKNEVTNISLDKSSAALLVGQTDSLITTLEATGDLTKLPQSWTSSNIAVATVKAGLVTAKSAGTTIITVQAGEKTATCQITVDDKILPAMTQGELWYWGDAYETATDTIALSSSNNFTVYLGSAGINMANLSGNGEIMVIELNAPLTVKDSIPVGIYDMMSELTQNQLTKNTLVPAYLDKSYTQWGCWYYGKTTNPIFSGNVVVTRSGNVYKLVYELFDDYGVKISGTFQGQLTYVDGTSSAGVKSNLKAVHPASMKQTMKFIRR